MTANDDAITILLLASFDLSRHRQWGTRVWHVPLMTRRMIHHDIFCLELNLEFWTLTPRRGAEHEWPMLLAEVLSLWLRWSGLWVWGTCLWPIQTLQWCDFHEPLECELALLDHDHCFCWLASSMSIGLELIQRLTLIFETVHDGLNVIPLMSWRHSSVPEDELSQVWKEPTCESQHTFCESYPLMLHDVHHWVCNEVRTDPNVSFPCNPFPSGNSLAPCSIPRPLPPFQPFHPRFSFPIPPSNSQGHMGG